jgi:hypothetical protein
MAYIDPRMLGPRHSISQALMRVAAPPPMPPPIPPMPGMPPAPGGPQAPGAAPPGGGVPPPSGGLLQGLPPTPMQAAGVRPIGAQGGMPPQPY